MALFLIFIHLLPLKAQLGHPLLPSPRHKLAGQRTPFFLEAMGSDNYLALLLPFLYFYIFVFTTKCKLKARRYPP